MIWQQTNGLAPMRSVDSVDQATNGAFFIACTAWNGPVGFGGFDFVVVKTSPEPPVLSTSSTPDDVKTRGFLLDVFSRSGTNICEWSPNAMQWLALSTNVSSGYPYRVTDWGATNSPQRFYRVSEVR